MSITSAYVKDQKVIVKRTSGEFEVWTVKSHDINVDGYKRVMVIQPFRDSKDLFFCKYPKVKDLFKWEAEWLEEQREKRFIANMEQDPTGGGAWAEAEAEEYANNTLAEMLG